MITSTHWFQRMMYRAALPPTSSEMVVQPALNAMVRDSLRPVALTLAALYVFFAGMHFLVLPMSAALPMMLLAITTGTAFALIAMLLSGYVLPEQHAHSVALGMMTLVLLNCFVHLVLVGEPLQSTNIALAVIGAGCWFLSLPALRVLLLGVWATWSSIAFSTWLSDSSPVWVHFAFMLVGATVVALLTHSVRVRTTVRLELLRRQDAHKQTELTDALRSFQQSEARFRSLAEASFEGIIVHDDVRVLDANLAVAEMTGYAVADLIGMPLHALVASGIVMASHPANDGPTTTEIVGRRKNGVRFPAEVCSKVVPYHGQLAHVVAVRDLSERQRATEALRASEERYALAVAGANDGVWDWQIGTGTVYYSPRWMHMLGVGESTHEHTIATWVDRIHPDDRVQVEALLTAHLEGATSQFVCEHRVRHHDGTYRWMLTRGVCVRDTLGQPTRMAGSQTDMTDQKHILHDLAAAKAAADTANRAKSAFLATMSHELRTPLTAILGYSEILQEQAEEKGVVDALPEIQRIHRAGNQLRSLINDVLDLSKIESGKMELYVQPFLLQELIADVVSMVQPLLETRGNQLMIEQPAKLGIICADQTKVRQVLLNVLSNAAKFTSAGTVALRITRGQCDGEDEVVFEVTDTGIGMSAEQVSELFQPFVQADASITRRFGGTGLGLALSQRFCQLMGGEIAVTSEEGVGTTFLIRLPVHVPEHTVPIIH